MTRFSLAALLIVATLASFLGGCGSSTTGPAPSNLNDDPNPSPGGDTSDTTAPSAPGNPQASATTTSLNLSWTASTDNVGVVGYQVTRVSPQKSATVTATSYLDTGLTPDTSYSYEIKAVDAAGNASAAATLTTKTAIPVVDTSPPSAPTGLSAQAQSTSVDLSWNASSDDIGVAFYEIFRDGNSVGTSNITAFTDTGGSAGLTKGTTYSYQVKAIDGGNNQSALSTALSVTTDTSNVSFSAYHSAVDLTWARALPEPDSYEVYRNGSSYRTGLANRLFVDSDAPPGTYTYQIYTKTGANAAQPLADSLVTVTTNSSSELFTIVIENTSDTPLSNIPVTIGQPFKKGFVKPNDFLKAFITGTPDTEITPLQLDRKATHADGTLRHGIISFVLPALAANESKVIRFDINHGTSPISPQTSTCTPPADSITAQITIGGQVYSANAVAKLNDPGTKMWLEGAVATEWIIDGDLELTGTPHPDLDVYFHVRCYSTGDVRTDFVMENTVAHRTQQNFTYDWLFNNGGTNEASPAPLEHFARARFRKTLWSSGAAPSINVKHDTTYVIGTRAVPNYSQASPPSNSILSGYGTTLSTTDYSPMKPGDIETRFSANAEASFDINWSVDYLLTGDKRAFQVMMNNANAAGSFGVHYRDSKSADNPTPSTGTMVPNVLEHPTIWISSRSTVPPIDFDLTRAGDPDSAHQDSFAYMPYLLTGDYYLLEEILFWTNWNFLLYNEDFRNGYQGFDGIPFGSQIRSHAWNLRELARSAYITPDDPDSTPDNSDKDYFNKLLANNIGWHTAEYVGGPSDNAFGVMTQGAVDDGIRYEGWTDPNDPNRLVKTGNAPWQAAWLTSVVGHINNLDVLPNQGALELLKWRSRFVIGTLNNPTEFCYILASSYNLQLADATRTLYSNFAQVYEATTMAGPYEGFGLSADRSDCNTQAMADKLKAERELASTITQGAMVFSSSPNHIWANLQGSVSVVVDAGVKGAYDAWINHQSSTVKPDFTRTNRYNIIPLVR